ncbi:MAG TPA: phosphoribosylformimino-5-aminoimidazole carboxamide ribotide isomerase [Candidatus Choladousia intestinavium]|uniref:Phosphoribosylformimino-5-aminoimidazole carboxamide ribotide isomerase n=1 Tax=Candidatus Choladousia intestinavium TaxID=2840727 RepID=A0A9D1AES5_9FIRM|nr:phosphoribosylformimino-5-aminoimidazole carboxamide ribotide isomerase [Candidatus Choladousia intestinavium]
MRFRPCIDIHNGKVKQIVGGSLRDEGDRARENFVSSQDAAFYAKLYKKDGLEGGHIILLNPASSPYYQETRRQALCALGAAPGSFQVGGGINGENAGDFLEAGASHVIVTSYVFSDGRIKYEHLETLRKKVGKERLVLDLSCRERDGKFYIVTDRWQKFTEVLLNFKTMDQLSGWCSEFLVHAADVEGQSRGVQHRVASLLGEWGKLPVTYAGGVGSYEDLALLRKLGRGRVDVTVGSALDLFGGPLSYKKILKLCKNDEK